MLGKMLWTALLILSFFLLTAGAAEQGLTAASEETKTRLTKQEIISLMLKIKRMPPAQQNSRIAQITRNQADSRTPRSDFEFCMGLAYLGNDQAQACAAKAYERGVGIVEDLSDAYVWRFLALENAADDAARKSLEEEKERLILKLRSIYPSPSDEELEELVRAEKNRLADYQKEAAKAKK